MRIDDKNISGVGETSNFAAVNSSGSGRLGQTDGTCVDTVFLSDASNLIALARSVGSPDKQSRIATLTNQVRTGTYQANLLDTSRAILSQSR